MYQDGTFASDEELGFLCNGATQSVFTASSLLLPRE
jgi:hypothetical protein